MFCNVSGQRGSLCDNYVFKTQDTSLQGFYESSKEPTNEVGWQEECTFLTITTLSYPLSPPPATPICYDISMATTNLT